jgi:hypothetical protein
MDAKVLKPNPLAVGGAQFQIAFDVDPDQFPHGCEFIIMRPGSIEPLGKMEVVRGCLIAVIPPEVAHHMRPMIKKSIADQAKQAAANGIQ